MLVLESYSIDDKHVKMYQIEVNKRINEIIKVVYQLGIWRNEDELAAHRKMGRKLCYLIFYLYFVVSVILGGLLTNDKNESIYLVAMGIAISVASVKLIYSLWRKEEICAFIHKIGVHPVTDYEVFIKVNSKVNNLMKFSSGFILLTFATAVFVNILCLPVLSSEKRLQFNIWFPFDWKNNEFAYWLAYVFVSACVMISASTILMNVIVWYLMMNCAVKYQILENQFKGVSSAKLTTKKGKISEKEKQKLFLEELIGLIKTHQNIKETVDQFNSCFANLFLAQITTSGICLCGSVYLLAFGDYQENFIEFVIFIVFMLYNIFDIFMVMFLGNEIKVSSDRLSYCLFESNWIEQSKSCKKCIIILTEVLQQPHELVIHKLYPLTLETFTSILRLAYSMLNILQNLN